ncbi:hypothetical protein GCM10010911_67490 [Paenibacillus nasutitermitis]|uniref:Uncharacterized protein n=1 Tax=Paenibacillus nasutitermitis TaxID=1652958 RepID=A0A916ZI62_9BACL|nr:hypothetical protein GCM10010911_67490 [Paenibacillus nasutitermitis]
MLFFVCYGYLALVVRYIANATDMKNVTKAMIYLEGLKALKYSMQFVQEENSFRY